MYMKLLQCIPIAFSLIISFAATGQDRPIGYWRAHMPYNTAKAVATDGNMLYIATEQSFYTYDRAANETTPYSKVEGMADVQTSYVAYDITTNTAVLAYLDGNIDLFSNGTFFNIPDLKLKNVSGQMNIYHIYTDAGMAYLSTDIGIIVVNLSKKEIKETYAFVKGGQFISNTGLTGAGNSFYAATGRGLYKAAKNNPNLQAFSVWQKLDTVRNFISIAMANDKVFATTADSLFVVEADTLRFLYKSDTQTVHIDPAADGNIWLSKGFANFTGRVVKLSSDTYQFIDSFDCNGHPGNLVEMSGTAWVADKFNGLFYRNANNVTPGPTPPGPATASSFDVYANNKDLLVAHGSADDKWVPRGNRMGFSTFGNEEWKSYRNYIYPPFSDTMFDFIKIVRGPDGNIYAGSYQSGLVILKPDGSSEIIKYNGIFDPTIGTSGREIRVSSLAFDDQGYLWMTLFGAQHELLVRNPEGVFTEFSVPFARAFANAAAHLIIDDNGQKWYAAPRGGGLIVYNDNSTRELAGDDSYRQLLAGVGAGNLPNNEVYSLAKDKNGNIWVGTGDGIGIISCPSLVISGECESESRIVQYDDFAGFLFKNELVAAIAVDGANRKWIGTSNGVWLLSPEGDEIIYRFTVENSPLPSNTVQKITIDPVTGDVYIGTIQGLVSFHSTATDAPGGEIDKNAVKVFPNPVTSGYNGTIAINGVMENADVRITDINGQLVFRTQALGGQAVWNGLDYTGRRPQSGVYLIFATNRDGSQTYVGKMVFME